MKKTVALIAASLLATVALTGCGGDDSSGSDSGYSTSDYSSGDDANDAKKMQASYMLAAWNRLPSSDQDSICESWTEDDETRQTLADAFVEGASDAHVLADKDVVLTFFDTICG